MSLERTNPLTRLSAYAASWQTRRLDEELSHHARRAFIDWFGCLLAGKDKAPATLLAQAIEPDSGRAVCYIDNKLSSLRRAALINATASHIVEFDDIYRDAAYHPGPPTIGAAFAAAQSLNRSFADLLTALVVGYEVSCRIGVAVQPSHYRFWHTTGTVGTFGASASVAFLHRSNETQMTHALATAATMAGGLQQAFRSSGMSKPLHAGHAADAGALAALAAMQGVTGAPDVLDGPAGFAAATSENTGRWDKALDTLDQSFAIANMTFKNHGCCGHIFAPLDAIGDLKSEHGFDPNAVESIEVSSYQAAKDVCDRPNAKTPQEARFSLQYTVANMLLYGGVRLDAFSEARLADEKIRDLMKRVHVRVDPECEARFPSQRSAKVSVRLSDGRIFERFQPTRKGDPDAPLSDSELSDKFIELAAPAVGKSIAERVLQNLWSGHELPRAINE